MWHWLAHHFGTDNGSGGYYLFWSGVGSDLLYISVIGWAWKMLNCHQYGCWRVGTKVTVEDNGHHYRRCTKHHKARHDTVA